MKKITGIVFVFVSTVAVFFTSCEKYLDYKSDATLLTPRSLEDLQALLDDSRVMNLRMTPSLGESVADDYYVSTETLNSFNSVLLDLYLWRPIDFVGVGNDWGLGYQAVYNSNLVFDLLPLIDRTEFNSLAYDNVLGSAYFYRAFYFLGLTVQFGHAFDEHTSDQDLGIVLRLTSDFNVPSTRASVRECYEQIIEDLTQATLLLPDYAEHLMRPSKVAAYALLARTYLFMRKYDLALDQSEKALAFNDQLMDFNGDEDILGFTSNAPVKKYNKETIFYAEASTSPIYMTPIGIIDSLLFDSYHESDLRKTCFFRIIDGDAYFKGNYTGSEGVNFSGISTNELYLIQAEAKAFSGDIQGAMDVLNFFLKNRYDQRKFLDYTAANREEALIIVREERRKELLIRNLRWADIKRYNKEGSSIVLRRLVNGQLYELQPNDPFYALPLPKAIIDLTNMPQN